MIQSFIFCKLIHFQLIFKIPSIQYGMHRKFQVLCLIENHIIIRFVSRWTVIMDIFLFKWFFLLLSFSLVFHLVFVFSSTVYYYRTNHFDQLFLPRNGNNKFSDRSIDYDVEMSNDSVLIRLNDQQVDDCAIHFTVTA